MRGQRVVREGYELTGLTAPTGLTGLTGLTALTALTAPTELIAPHHRMLLAAPTGHPRSDTRSSWKKARRHSIRRHPLPCPTVPPRSRNPGTDRNPQRFQAALDLSLRNRFQAALDLSLRNRFRAALDLSLRNRLMTGPWRLDPVSDPNREAARKSALEQIRPSRQPDPLNPRSKPRPWRDLTQAHFAPSRPSFVWRQQAVSALEGAR